jgi:hypothetical protein
MKSGVQLRLDGLPLDPVEISALPAVERARLFDEPDLDRLQRAAAEDAVWLVIAKAYGRRSAS